MSGLTKKFVALAGLSAFVAGNAVAAELTVVSWGGAYTKSQVEAYHKPWMAKTSKTIKPRFFFDAASLATTALEG